MYVTGSISYLPAQLLLLNYRYLQLNCRYLQIGLFEDICKSIGEHDDKDAGDVRACVRACVHL